MIQVEIEGVVVFDLFYLDDSVFGFEFNQLKFCDVFNFFVGLFVFGCICFDLIDFGGEFLEFLEDCYDIVDVDLFLWCIYVDQVEFEWCGYCNYFC